MKNKLNMLRLYYYEFKNKLNTHLSISMVSKSN